jgi:hypothetical protein
MFADSSFDRDEGNWRAHVVDRPRELDEADDRSETVGASAHEVNAPPYGAGAYRGLPERRAQSAAAAEALDYRGVRCCERHAAVLLHVVSQATK